jgi:hypothetical protein
MRRKNIPKNEREYNVNKNLGSGQVRRGLLSENDLIQ